MTQKKKTHLELTRRAVVSGVAASACTGLVGQSPRDAGTTDAGGEPELDGGSLDAGDNVPAPQGKYVFQQPLLFQRAHVRELVHSYTNSLGQLITVPSVVATFDGSTTQGAAQCGTTRELMCAASRRPWAHPGGDWVDLEGTSQGLVPFATSSALSRGATGVATLDVTKAVEWIFANKHWLAFFIRVTGGGLATVGVLNGSAEPPGLTLTDANGADERLTCWYTASARASTAYTNAQQASIDLSESAPGVFEFYRASRPGERVSSGVAMPQKAMLSVPYSEVFGAPKLEVYVVHPALPPSLAPVPGLAAAYALDEGLMNHSAVAMATRITDADSNADVLDEVRCGSASNPWVPNADLYGNFSEATFDPFLFTPTPGEGAFAAVPVPTERERDTLFPRRLHSPRGSKFFGSVTRKTAETPQDAVRVVHSDDATALSRGFRPLASGMGALEVMYGGGAVKNGQSTFASVTGSQSVDLRSTFREQHAGRVVDGYLRMYVLLGEGWGPSEDGLAWHYHAPSTTPAQFAKYPEELGLSPDAAGWRRLDRTGKFPGGIQQVTSGHTAMHVYEDPKRLNSNAQRVQLTGGGYSSSAGIQGYQGRWMFYQGHYKPGTLGPAVGGLALGVELYDFNGGAGVTIPSQNPIGGWDSSYRSYATHVGGLGFLYPGRWYCVEMRWRMNTIKPYELPPPGTHWLEGGHNVDGFIEWWVDGIPAAKTPLFAHRSSAALVDWALQNSAGVPFDTVPGSPSRLRGISNVPTELYMGASEVVINAYYGGRTYCESNKYVYLNGIVATNGQYIGPMAGVSRENGGLG